MLASIFSSFDPSLTPTELPLIPLMVIFTLMILTQSFWMVPTTLSQLHTSTLCMTSSLLRPTAGVNMKGIHNTIYSMFYSIMLLNVMGMFPYVFSLTSHLFLTVSMALPLWTALILASLLKTPKKSLAKLLPESTPTPLNPFLTTVELISSCIRPLTLAFRLAANISAGHVILAMMSSFTINIIMNSSLFKLLPIISIIMFYCMFELIICMIQAFVFVLLTSMYTNDYL
uniref:ATP synthase F0 subunit 6 n=1 Tax=Ramisyllis kingghidorahi TaxID=2876589 RepID=UPI002176B358|nr:ATP synthase F0 subunit 6 [Ramisyllis kingghidorahi]UUF68148.1 ATP synthase F0 subunit 6 [Ramisyllis kingghidorahi]